jgi:hypothetical protein
MKFGTWNVKSLYRAGSAVTGKLLRFRLNLVVVEEYKWEIRDSNGRGL